MACYTYFPKAAVGTQDGAQSAYIRPCQSSCFNYIRACQVECCDESVQCVFTHTKQLSATTSVETSGYISHDGPSSLCTGKSSRTGPSAFLFLLIVAPLVWASGPVASATFYGARRIAGSAKGALVMLAVMAAMTFQGCDM